MCGLAGDWMLSMWNDLVFDTNGNLYVPDDKPRIWKVSPNGTATIWVTDPRLAGLFGFAGGPLGGRIDPSGQWLYVSITVAANPAWTSQIWRIRVVDHPTPTDIELVHEFPFDGNPATAPQATGLAFAKSGNLYVSLIGPNQIAVPDPSGIAAVIATMRSSCRAISIKVSPNALVNVVAPFEGSILPSAIWKPGMPWNCRASFSANGYPFPLVVRTCTRSGPFSRFTRLNTSSSSSML